MNNPDPVRRIEFLFQAGLVLALVLGCWLVLRPFFAAILFAIVVAVSTWPAYLRLLGWLGGRRQAAALLACIITVLVLTTPAALLVGSFADGFAWLQDVLGEWIDRGMPPPQWIADLPLIGAPLHDYWVEVISNPRRREGLVDSMAEPARRIALVSGRAFINLALQASLSALVLYFLYSSGEVLGERLRRAASRILGPLSHDLVNTLHQAVGGVLLSVVGTALAQAMVAAAGFAIAGVPQPLLLGAATFVLSMIPIGPPIIWGGAALWLFRSGETGWAVFMLLYGLLAISSVDNVLKPFLISRANRLPFAFTMMGIIGGVLAFGVIGVFIGPVLLAVTISVVNHWLDRDRAGEIIAPPSAGNGPRPPTPQ